MWQIIKGYKRARGNGLSAQTAEEPGVRPMQLVVTNEYKEGKRRGARLRTPRFRADPIP